MAIQELTQPIINPIAAFDSTKEHEITFIVIGGAQVTGNRIVISDNQTGNVVYNNTVNTMKLAHTIPANTLSNGGYYNAVIYTIDNSANESVPSTPVPFYCYSQPTLTITNIPATETIGNGTYEFQGNYLQTESEQLNSYQFILYDSNKDILDRSDIIYYQSNSSLAYTFVGMDNDTSYYVELKGQTVNNTEITSGLMYFTVRYTQPETFAIVDLINDCENGYIQISSNIVAIDGKSNPEPPIYIDDKEVDLRDKDSWVKWDEGFNINNDFTMRVWGRDFNDYERIISLANKENTPDNPNKIEMKWMIADVIETLPSYTSVSGKNVAIKNGFKTDIEDLEVMGNSEQISKAPVDLGTGNYIKAETTRDMYLDIQVQGNQYQKTQKGSKQSANGTEVYLTGVDSSKPADIVVNGNNYQETREGYNILPYPFADTTFQANGIKYTDLEDGSVNVNGTNTGYSGFALVKNMNFKAGTYTFFGNPSANVDENNFRVRIGDADNRDKLLGVVGNVPITLTFDKEMNINVLLQVLAEKEITISNVVWKPMIILGADINKKYEQYGASPSPDYPSEIQTVGSVKNILDMSNAKGGTSGGITCTMNEDGSYQYVGTATSSAINVWLLGSYGTTASTLFSLEPGTYYINGIALFEGTGQLNNEVGKYVYTFIQKQNITGVRVEAAVSGRTYDETKYPIIAKVDYKIPWVPYNYGSVQINTQNKNLLNLSKIGLGTKYGVTAIYNANNSSITFNGTCTRDNTLFSISPINIPYEKNKTTMTVQWVSGSASGSYIGSRFYNSNFAHIFSINLIPLNSTNKILNRTEGLNGTYVGFDFRIDNGAILDNFTVQVMLTNEVDTDYVPYQIQQIILPIQQEMLASDYIKRAERHTWGKVVFDGSEEWLKISYGFVIGVNTVDSNFKNRDKTKFDGYSNYFKVEKTSQAWTKINYCGWNTDGAFWIREDHTIAENIDDFKAWLKSKYDSGNPVVVYYQLATPTDLVLTDIQKAAQAQLTNMTIYQDITNITNESSYPAILNVDYNITRAMPSPEAPSEVETVGDNINYFDINSVTNFLIILESGNLYPNNSWRTTDFIEVKANIYTLSWDSITDYFQCNIAFYDKDKKYLSYIQYTNRTFSNTFEVKDNAKYMRISYAVMSGSTSVPKENIKLEIGDKRTTYSPYNQGSVEINIKNKNIMPISSLGTNWEYTSKGIRNNTNSNGKELFAFTIKNGQKINIGLNLISKPQVDTTFTIYVDGTPNIIGSFGHIENYELNQIYQREYTAIEDCNIGCRMYGNANKDIFEFQMWSEYDNLTEYTRHEEQSYIMPVQKPMLTGDYIIDIEHSGWEKIVADGVNNKVTSTKNTGYVIQTLLGTNVWKDGLGYSNQLTYDSAKTYRTPNTFIFTKAGAYLHFDLDLLGGLEINNKNMNAWLKERYDNGNPIYIIGQRATAENLSLTTEQQTIQSTLKPAYTDITNIYATEDLPILKASTLRVPSPSVPSPIYSSGDQRNLLEDLGSFDISYTQDYFKVTDTTFKLKPNFVYNLSFDYTINNASTDLYFTVCYKNGNDITDITGAVLYYNQATGRSNTSFMVPEDIPDNSTLSVKFVRTLISANVNVSISNVQLEKGRVANSYQKHGLYNIYPTAVQKNIFDYDKIYYVENKNTEISYIQNGISANLAGTNEIAYIAIGFSNVLQPGQKYAISYNSYGELLSSKLYTMNKETGERIEEIALDNGSFTAPSNVYDFLFEFTLNDTIENNQVQIWNIQIETGNQVTEYEVYKPNQTTITLDQPLRAIGNYKDIICLESLNLLNPQTQIANVKGGQSYYLSQTGTTQYQLDYLTEYGNLISSVNMASGRITAPDTCVQIRVNASSSDITSNKLQINEGATAEIYYPYVSEPSVIRYCNEIMLDGNENWVYLDKGVEDMPQVRFLIPFVSQENTNVMCNYLTAYGNGITLYSGTYKNAIACGQTTSFGNVLRIKVGYDFINVDGDSTLTSYYINALKDKLKQLKSSGDPIIVNYILAEPQIYKLSPENVSALKGLKTYDGNSNVFTNNNMPANINFSYISGQSEQEAKNAYITLKCWNGNVMPYFVHSNYIDIPKETDKVFIWVRKKNNIFDLKIENLGDYQGEET